MTIIAAFLWRKSPHKSISTFILDKSELKILLPPKRFIFSGKLFSFRRETKSVIQHFSHQLSQLAETDAKIIVEFKIVFNVITIPWMKASSESKLVYKLFMKEIKRLQNDYPNIELKPQIRRKLSGKPLKIFKRELKRMGLVSRKRDTGYEYHLWAVALHVTSETYEKTIKWLGNTIMDMYWNKSK